MLFFIIGFFLAYFFLPLVQSLEVLLQQKIEVKKMKYVKEIYDIRNSMDLEDEEESPYEIGFNSSLIGSGSIDTSIEEQE